MQYVLFDTRLTNGLQHIAGQQVAGQHMVLLLLVMIVMSLTISQLITTFIIAVIISIVVGASGDGHFANPAGRSVSGPQGSCERAASVRPSREWQNHACKGPCT